MTARTRRLIILADEWLGIVLLTYLWRAGERAAFWWVFGAWAFAVYFVSYPLYWLWLRRQREGAHDSAHGTSD